MPPITLQIEKVRKSYGPRRVLRDVSLNVAGGEAVAITGPNGTGKSTLIKVVAGLLRPSQGTVTLSTFSGSYSTATERRKAVGYCAPDLALYPELTGRENLLFFARVRGLRLTAEECDARLEQVGLSGRGNDPMSAYSSGMRQRLRLAFALLAEPPLLLLDEPSLALDEKGVALVADIIVAQRMRGGVTLLATNDSREVALGDRTLALAG